MNYKQETYVTENKATMLFTSQRMLGTILSMVIVGLTSITSKQRNLNNIFQGMCRISEKKKRNKKCVSTFFNLTEFQNFHSENYGCSLMPLEGIFSKIELRKDFSESQERQYSQVI